MPLCLQGTAKERFNEIQQELSKLSTTFGNNVLDATKAYKRLLTGEELHPFMQAFTQLLLSYALVLTCSSCLELLAWWSCSCVP